MIIFLLHPFSPFPPCSLFRCCSDIKQLRKEREFVIAAKRILDNRPRATSDGTCDIGPVARQRIQTKNDNNNNNKNENTDIQTQQIFKPQNRQYTSAGIRYYATLMICRILNLQTLKLDYHCLIPRHWYTLPYLLALPPCHCYMNASTQLYQVTFIKYKISCSFRFPKQCYKKLTIKAGKNVVGIKRLLSFEEISVCKLGICTTKLILVTLILVC